MARRDGVHDAALDGLIHDLSRSPVRHGSAALLWQLTGDGEDLCELLWRELRGGARSWRVLQQPHDKASEVLVFHALLLRLYKPMMLLCPSHPPPPYPLSIDAEFPRLLDVGDSIRRHQDDAGTLDQAVGSVCLVAAPSFEDAALALGHTDLDGSGHVQAPLGTGIW